jgi:hypothetical protein
MRRTSSGAAWVAASYLAAACSGIRLADVKAPRPVPANECLVIGFLGGRDRWDDDTKGVRQVALELRRLGFFAETFENQSRDVARDLVREALDSNSNGHLDERETRRARLVVYGQSFGGAAVIKFAKELDELGVPLELTIQIDSVGQDDGLVPANVRHAANLFQNDGWFIRGENPLRAVDHPETRILGNWRFDYSEPPGSEISLAGVPWWKLAFRIPHARMDRDPRVWSFVRRLIPAACTGASFEGIAPTSSPSSCCRRTP